MILWLVTFRYFQHGNHILCWEDEVGDREPITSYSYCIHSLHFLAQILRRTGWWLVQDWWTLWSLWVLWVLWMLCVCVWNCWTEVEPLLLLVFQLSDFSRGPMGTWMAWANEDPSKLLCKRTVPPIVESWWDVANQRTTMPLFKENHFWIWIKHMNGRRWLLIFSFCTVGAIWDCGELLVKPIFLLIL